LKVISTASVSVANAGSLSQVVIEGSNAQLTQFKTTVQDGTVTLEKVVLTGAFAVTGSATLNIGSQSFDSDSFSGSEIVFKDLNLSLTEKDHTFTVTTNINTDNASTGVIDEIKGVLLSYDNGQEATRTLNAKYLFVKASPTLSLVKSDNNQLIVKITNGNNSAITLSGIIATNATGATLDGQTVASTIANGTPTTITNPVTLAKGESAELRLDIAAAGVAKLTGIEYTLSQGGNDYTYSVNDTYTNVARWGDLQVTYKS
jgi:hypothetical protein